MFERQERILEIVKESKRIPLRELALQLNVSEITIRRDLKEMQVDKPCFIKSSIVYFKEPNNHELVDKKYTVNQLGKKTIAKKAIQKLEPGDVIAVDIGSTNFELAKELLSYKEPLIIFTSSIEIAYILSSNDYFEVYMIPGLVRKNRYSVVGALSIDFINSFNIDYFFLGAAGINGGRVYDYIIEEVELKKRIINQSKETVLLIDQTKFGMKALIKICDFSDITEIITDNLPQPYQKSYGAKVLLAGED